MFTFSLPYGEAIKIAKKLAHSASSEQTRCYLNGFFAHSTEKGEHYAVSTDGHRLTRLRIYPSYTEGSFPAVIFPLSAFKQLESIKVKAGDKYKALVHFTIDDRKYVIRCDDFEFIGRLIDASYPDYSRVIPSDWSQYSGNMDGSGFNALYIADVAKAASYDAENFRATGRPIRIFSQGSSPAVIQEQDPDVLYVLMPMRAEFEARLKQSA